MSQMAHISIHAINHTKSTNNYTPTQSECCASTGCFLVFYLGVKCKKPCLTHVSMSRKQINSRKREFSQQAQNVLPWTRTYHTYHTLSFQALSQPIFFSVTTQKLSKLEAQWILTEKDYN